MKSLKDLYKKGYGPSSSHTMGPVKACLIMKERYPSSLRCEVTLYGSLALTGKGHLTDIVCKRTFAPLECEVKFDLKSKCDYHPNTLDITAFLPNNTTKTLRFYSIGGGSIEIEGEDKVIEKDVYPHNSFDAIKEYISKNNMSLVDYVYKYEDKDIYDYMLDIYNSMKDCICRGLNKEGKLPGSLEVDRKAKQIYYRTVNKSADINRRIFAYAYAVSEENASGNEIVTAPTCGSCGLIPSILLAFQEKYKYKNEKIIDALMVGGLIGNLVKQNASISGAEAGCQAEIGTACAMGAAAICYLLDGNIDQIEQASEIALEHHLGLTCDPVAGYVQIPCIERNAICALRAVDCAKLVTLLQPGTNKISFDLVVKTMLQTGKDLRSGYRETAKAGLAKEYH